MASISHGTLVPERSLVFFFTAGLVPIFSSTGERKFFWRAGETVSCSGFVTTRHLKWETSRRRESGSGDTRFGGINSTPLRNIHQ
jgi:hypothetical protein